MGFSLPLEFLHCGCLTLLQPAHSLAHRLDGVRPVTVGADQLVSLGIVEDDNDEPRLFKPAVLGRGLQGNSAVPDECSPLRFGHVFDLLLAFLAFHELCSPVVCAAAVSSSGHAIARGCSSHTGVNGMCECAGGTMTNAFSGNVHALN